MSISAIGSSSWALGAGASLGYYAALEAGLKLFCARDRELGSFYWSYEKLECLSLIFYWKSGAALLLFWPRAPPVGGIFQNSSMSLLSYLPLPTSEAKTLPALLLNFPPPPTGEVLPFLSKSLPAGLGGDQADFSCTGDVD